VPRPIRVALLTSSAGTVLFVALGQLMLVFGSIGETVGCFIGAFLSTLLVHRHGGASIVSNLLPATAIVVFTLFAIAVGHALEQPLLRGVPIDSEWRGFLFWAFLLGPWWLIPGCAWVLSYGKRIQNAPAA